MKYIALIISFTLSQSSSYAMEQQEKNNCCYLAYVPKEIQNYIASYLELSTPKFETNNAFKERLRKGIKKIRQGETIKVIEGQQLQIDDYDNLELTWHWNFIPRTKQLVESTNYDEWGVIAVFSSILEQDPLQNITNFCVVSLDRSKAAALVDTNEIKIIDLMKQDEISVLYFGTQEEKEKKIKNCSNKTNVETHYMPSLNYDEIGALAVTNDAQYVAFTKKESRAGSLKESIFLVDTNTGAMEEVGKYLSVKDIAFNGQGTCIGINYKNYEEIHYLDEPVKIPFWKAHTIKLKEEVSLTFANYLAKRGVCKNLNNSK